MEVTILIKCLCISSITTEVTWHNRWTLQHYFTLIANLYINTLKRSTHRTNSIRLPYMVTGNGCQALSQAITNNHGNTDAMYKLLYLWRNIGSSCWEEMWIFQA